MKFDIVKEIDGYLTRANRKPLTEAQKAVLTDINESGFPEIKGLHIRPDNFHRIDDSGYVMVDCSATLDTDPDFYIYEDEIDAYTYKNGKLSIEYRTTDKHSLKHLNFRKNEDRIAIVSEEDSEDMLIKVYLDGVKYTFNRGIPEIGDPDIVCKLRKGHNTDEYSDCYYVTDPSKRITDDDKPIRIGTGDNVEYELPPQDFYSELRALRAIGELVCDLYHEKYLFEGKKRVLSRVKTGQVRLDG